MNLEIVQRCQMQGRDIQQIVWLEFHALSDDFFPYHYWLGTGMLQCCQPPILQEFFFYYARLRHH